MADVLDEVGKSTPNLVVEINVAYTAWREHIDPDAIANKALSTAILHVVNKLTSDAEVSVLFCDDATTQGLNKNWRGLDKPTNVLSFPTVEFPEPNGPHLLGDIIVSFETCKNEAEGLSLPMETHVVHLLVHGLLHLLGYDHVDDEGAGKMENLEVLILKEMGIANPYE